MLEVILTFLDKISPLPQVLLIFLVFRYPLYSFIVSGGIAGVTIIVTYNSLISWLLGGTAIIIFGGVIVMFLYDYLRFRR